MNECGVVGAYGRDYLTWGGIISIPQSPLTESMNPIRVAIVVKVKSPVVRSSCTDPLEGSG